MMTPIEDSKVVPSLPEDSPLTHAAIVTCWIDTAAILEASTTRPSSPSNAIASPY